MQQIKPRLKKLTRMEVSWTTLGFADLLYFFQDHGVRVRATATFVGAVNAKELGILKDCDFIRL